MGTLKYVTDDDKIHASILTAHQRMEELTKGASSGSIRYLTPNGNIYTDKATAVNEVKLEDLKHTIFNPEEIRFWNRLLGKDRLNDLLNKIIFNRQEVVDVLMEDL